MDIRVQSEDFDLNAELRKMRESKPQIGALVSFIGLVRDRNEGESVAAMELEHYPGMTEKSLTQIAAIAERQWNLQASLIIHRVGKLSPCDQIVLVAAASAHRGEAFAACEFMMDYLKTEAPFWKKESTAQGERWVDARISDDAAMAKWAEVLAGEKI